MSLVAPFVFAALAAVSSPRIADQLDRLEGHLVEVSADGQSYAIRDIAGDGAPIVGVVEREGDGLVLVAGEDRIALRGNLARPRIAGPGYKVWVIGPRDQRGITIRRIGILEAPQR